MAEKKITLKIAENELKFNVNTGIYNKYVNEIKPDDKVSPSLRFLRLALVDEKQRPTLDELCDQGLTVEIAGALVEEFKPKLEIEVKK